MPAPLLLVVVSPFLTAPVAQVLGGLTGYHFGQTTGRNRTQE